VREQREKRQEDDDNRMFQLSLVNHIKKVPEHMKLSRRSQIMQVIDAASNSVFTTIKMFLLFSHKRLACRGFHSRFLIIHLQVEKKIDCLNDRNLIMTAKRSTL